MNKHLFAIVMTTSILLSGCFGTTEEPEEPEPPELSDWDVYYVQSGSELPACGSETLGRLYFVAETTAFEVCTISGWSFVDLTGPAGADGEQGPQGEKGDPGDKGDKGDPGLDGQDVDPALVAKLQANNTALSQQISHLEAQLINATSCQLVPYGNCPGADLRGMNLTGMDLTGINLRDADLQNTTFDYATLDGADLRSIFASNATFIGTGMNRTFLQFAEFNRYSQDCPGEWGGPGYCGSADLTDAHLRFADLTSARLVNANLYDADLAYANLYNAQLANANLIDADLLYADLTDANLRDADLESTNLEYADLTDARLTFANLYYTDLSNADLTDAYLGYANLYDADLSNADLKFADFSYATISAGTSFTFTYWHQTEWTDGVRYDSNQA